MAFNSKEKGCAAAVLQRTAPIRTGVAPRCPPFPIAHSRGIPFKFSSIDIVVGLSTLLHAVRQSFFYFYYFSSPSLDPKGEREREKSKIKKSKGLDIQSRIIYLHSFLAAEVRTEALDGHVDLNTAEGGAIQEKM